MRRGVIVMGRADNCEEGRGSSEREGGDGGEGGVVGGGASADSE